MFYFTAHAAQYAVMCSQLIRGRARHPQSALQGATGGLLHHGEAGVGASYACRISTMAQWQREPLRSDVKPDSATQCTSLLGRVGMHNVCASQMLRHQ